MSRNYDNWERLVAAVVHREEIWQLCHEDSTEPSIHSDSSDFSSTCNSPLVNESLTSTNLKDGISVLPEKNYKPGIYVTVVPLPDGTRFVKRVRFSRMGFEEQHQAVIWWFKNREKVFRRYNAHGGNARIRRPYIFVFSSSSLIDHQYDEEEEGREEEMRDESINDDKASKSVGNKEELPQAMERSSDLLAHKMIALQELKHLVQEALNRHELSSSPDEQEKKEKVNAYTEEQPPAKAPEEVFIWGVKLLQDERTIAVLLKFLRARDFKAKEAFTMIKNTIRCRKEFGIDELILEDLDSELGKVVFMHGHSKQGNPVCYNMYGELYWKTFSGEVERSKFLRWRIQFLEKSVRKLDFGRRGISTIVQVNDLKNSPGPNIRDLRQVTNLALQVLQDYYPELVDKQIFINAPKWYLAFYRIISPLLTSRTKSKFVFAGPSLSMATLFKYISADQIPPQYGGLNKNGDYGSDETDSVTEIVVKPSDTHIEEFLVLRACVVRSEVRVVGWEVSYGAEFFPSAEDGHTVILEKTRIIGSTYQEQIFSSSYEFLEPGKLVLTCITL